MGKPLPFVTRASVLIACIATGACAVAVDEPPHRSSPGGSTGNAGAPSNTGGSSVKSTGGSSSTGGSASGGSTSSGGSSSTGGSAGSGGSSSTGGSTASGGSSNSGGSTSSGGSAGASGSTGSGGSGPVGDCAGAKSWAAGDGNPLYALDAKVAHNGKLYTPKLPIYYEGPAHEPGTGANWQDHWTDAGSCN